MGFEKQLQESFKKSTESIPEAGSNRSPIKVEIMQNAAIEGIQTAPEPSLNVSINENPKKNHQKTIPEPDSDEEFKMASAITSMRGTSIKSQLSANIRIRCSPIDTQPSQRAVDIGLKQMIINKIPTVDVNTLHGKNLEDLDKLLKISRTVKMMEPRSRN